MLKKSMKIYRDFIFIGIGLTLGFFLFRSCSEPQTHDRVVTIHGDSVPYIVRDTVPVVHRIIERDSIPYPVVIRVPIPTDTAAILAQFTQVVQYRDTVKNDTSALIVINQDLIANRINSQQVIFQNRRPIQLVYTREKALIASVGATINGIDLGFGFRNRKNACMVTYSNLGLGVRYLREF